MALRIVCSGYLVRYPLGGFCWHHLQYLVGFRRMGHDVTYFEHYGWPGSCYDPGRNDYGPDPAYGLEFLRGLLRPHGMGEAWCYLAEDGAEHGMPREDLAQRCREADVYVNLSNINWIDEVRLCRRRALVDTDPVFAQIGGFGMGGAWSEYDAMFTYGQNVHAPGCDMPTGGARWLPTRQPVVPDLWPVAPGDPGGPFTSVMSWSAYGDRVHEGRVYGQKDREFEPYFDLPRRTGLPMELAVNAPPVVRARLADGGWALADPLGASRTPGDYQAYLARSRAEFSVAKHAYVSARCGWFSDRSCGYLVSGRPVVVQDTGFTRWLPAGRGVLAWRTPAEAAAGLRAVAADYAGHCRRARELVEEFFGADLVLGKLLEQSMG